MLKTLGYIVSTLSVILLATVAWDSTEDDSFLRACLVLGSLASIAGMGLRWLSFRADERPHQSERRTSAKPASIRAADVSKAS